MACRPHFRQQFKRHSSYSKPLQIILSCTTTLTVVVKSQQSTSSSSRAKKPVHPMPCSHSIATFPTANPTLLGPTNDNAPVSVNQKVYPSMCCGNNATTRMLNCSSFVLIDISSVIIRIRTTIFLIRLLSNDN